MMVRLFSLLLFCLAPALVGCGKPTPQPPAPSPSAKADAPGFVLTSPAFKNNEAIPTKYTADGEGISPPLAWSGAPKTTREFALIMDDPDAPSGAFTHWVVYSIPSESTSLPENISAPGKAVTDFPHEGKNGANTIGYFPPSPPPGKVHHYVFHFYAVDMPIPLNPDMTGDDLRRTINGHLLATAELTGAYQRTR